MKPAARSQRLLLFDIDGTLIHKGGMGSAAMGRAFAARHGLEGALRGVSLHGRTDWSICREVFERHALSWSDDAWRAVIDAYVDCLHEEARERPCGELCPGVSALLDTLAQEADFVVGLLTGNVRRGAEIKLRTFGIWGHFRLGAYGCERERREDLVEVARARAVEVLGLDYSPRQVVVIGDTPADVAAARHGGCISIAVATGRYTTKQLEQEGADVVLEDLRDIDRVLDAFRMSLEASAAI